MEHLTRVATELTNMDMASVAVLRDNDTHFEIIASYGQDPPMDVKRFRVEEIPTAKICIETGRVFPVPDTRGPLPEGLNLNTQILEKFGIRAILQIPLRVEGKSIGALALGCRSPHPFSEADLRLAELLGSQTAVILHNSGLIERTRTAMKAQKRLTEQRRRVYWVMAAVYQAGTMEESIRRVARMAPLALSVDTAVVCIPTDRPGYFRVAATGPQASSGSLVVGSVLHLSDAQRALTERRTRVVGAGQSGSVGEASSGDSVFGDVETGSAAYLPLIAHAPEPIGVLVLIRRRGRGLRRVQLRMAKLLASRAAVAIESSRLHHRAQLDAAAKATLLRELNHRVKNNLAAISGLLSIGQPPLDAPALAWLDRAVERINTMARAHELFTGGAGDVSLPQLIDQLMPTLEVLAPPGVTVLAQVDRSVNGPAARARLEPDQAVALAMVLHELCVNAIVHGLGDTGTLTVRADFTSGIDSTAPGLAVVEVVDAGGPGELSKGSMAHRSTGVGLDLVRDMVRRELSGTFTLDRQDAATTASVRFPLRRDDPVL